MSGPLLVTGATGLLGREALAALAAGPWTIVPTSRSAADLPGHRPCDLADPDAAAALVETVAPRAVVHLAGGTAADPHELYRRNVLSTVHLLEAAARLPARPYCVVLGSAAEYGDGAGELIAETAALEPVTEYGRAKAAQTRLAQGIARARDLPLTVLRPFNLVSPRLRDSTPLGNLRRQLLAGSGPERLVRCGRLDVVRDFVPLVAVAEALRRLLRSPAPGRTLNVCSGVGIELGSLLGAMAARLGVRLRVEQDPALVALPAARRVVGDPRALVEALGLDIPATPDLLAEIQLAQPSAGPRPSPKSSSS